MPRCAAPASAARPRRLLIDKAAPEKTYKPAIEALLDAGCEVRGDAALQKLDPRIKPASEEDFGKEFLDAIIAAKVVDGVDGAMNHIEKFGSHHTDAIITQDKAGGRALPERSRFRDRAAQCLDAIRRWRRIRLRRGDRHRHRPHACARAGRRRAAHLVQISRARQRANPAVNDQPRRTLVKSVTKPRITLPPHGPGMRIGLLGGSFNPPHDAHRAISLYAMKRLQLDRVWWIVTPGNPLKDARELPPLRRAHRAMHQARRSSAHRRHRLRGRHRHEIFVRYHRLAEERMLRKPISSG